MKLQRTLFWLLAFITTIHALALPSSLQAISDASQELFKRKGGGGKGGSSSSSSSSSESGSSSSSSSSGSGSGRGSTSSNSGGRTTTGSGTPRSYGGAYVGGGTVPYSAGQRSVGGISPFLLGGTALLIFPGLWLYGAYAYPYSHPYTYYNQTSRSNQTHPVTCLCGEYSECGCDDNNSTDYINSVANNNTVSKVSDVNGTQTLVINGTLDNGTTADGGDDDAYDSAAGSLKRSVFEASGWWIVIGGVACSLTLI